VRRIEQVRRALAQVLPSVAPVRNLGLIVFGPGARGVCENIDLRLPVAPNSAEQIMAQLDDVQPYVLLTDGEETCHGDPCALAQALKKEGRDVTLHVVGYMLRHASEPTGGQVARCLSEMTGGLFISTETTDELVAALQKTLGCPQFSSALPNCQPE
jgi:Ca-activated chloride channel family protein